MGISADYAISELLEQEKRRKIHEQLGFIKTYSCLPMHMGNLPRKGDYISWIGSCAQILANSLIGAKTNKDGTIINLCSALTGRTVYHGLLLDENRYAKVVIKLAKGVQLVDDVDYGALGYYVGSHVVNKNVVFDCIPRDATFDQLKYLIAPVATSGSVHICHIAGITPEAPNVEVALGGKEPEAVIVVTKENLEKTKNIFKFDPNTSVDLVLIGCPHVTVEEARHIAKLIKCKKIADGKRLWIGLGDATYTLVKAAGDAEIIEKAGGIFSHTCLATIPDSPLPENVKAVMTNSFKSAHYVNSLQQGKIKVMIGSLHECIGALTMEKRR